MVVNKNILGQVWGKAKKKGFGDEVEFEIHPLICHLIDTAAVTESLWDMVLTKSIKSYLSDTLFVSEENAKKWLIFLAGIHDLGKATPVFQSRIPKLASILSDLGLETYKIEKYHNILSGEIFARYLKSHVDGLKENHFEFIKNIKYIIGGHHGFFPRAEHFNELLSEHLGKEKWIKLQSDLIEYMLDFCELDFSVFKKTTIIQERFKNKERAAWIFIAGLISVADWIASSELNFNFYPRIGNIEEVKNSYFKISRARATQAIKMVGWTDWKDKNSSKVTCSFKEIFPFITKLRPLQDALVQNITTIRTPALVIIEAPMGEGKTEAALYLEHFLETSNNLQGAYIALPTQATANQMFQRVIKYLSNVKNGLRVNLHLLHGKAVINKDYEMLKTNSMVNEDGYSSIVADSWFTFRKRGLISPFGVGTIDQTLLSVFPIRHFFVRLFGLTGKVIILDEIHSYDIYMSTVLEHLLKWLKLLGSTVILLSATLPSLKRKQLIATYSQNRVTSIPTIKYPRITICNDSDIKVFNFETSLQKKGNNSVLMNWIDEDLILQKIKPLLINGGRIAIICNKVKRAQELYLTLKPLKEQEIDIDLLHSRFPFFQRRNKENDLIKKYGMRNGIDKHPKVLVSTQIIEQSLDLDFDLMISDLAPIDLIFQRMGRLHRHERDHHYSS